MQLAIEQFLPDDEHWQQLYERLQTVSSLSAVVLTARQMGLWLAGAIVEQQLRERAVASTEWGICLVGCVAKKIRGQGIHLIPCCLLCNATKLRHQFY